jgi:hypothetical protein
MGEIEREQLFARNDQQAVVIGKFIDKSTNYNLRLRRPLAGRLTQKAVDAGSLT